MQIIKTIKELILKDGKCYGIAKLEDGKEYGFILKGEPDTDICFTRNKTECDQTLLWSPYRNAITISMTFSNDKAMFELYDLEKFFLDRMGMKQNA